MSVESNRPAESSDVLGEESNPRPFKCRSCELSNPVLEGGEAPAAGTLLACGELAVVGEPVGWSDRFMRATNFATNETCFVSWSTSVAAEVVWPFVHASLPELAVFAMLSHITGTGFAINISVNTMYKILTFSACHLGPANVDP